jgi:hypothetical protein
MRKRTAIIVCTAAAAVIGIACSPLLIYSMRQCQLDAAKRALRHQRDRCLCRLANPYASLPTLWAILAPLQ